MGREIKFRGKRKDNGEWVYGHFWRNAGGTFIQSRDGNVYSGIHQVDYETVSQYSGLLDKNLREIYEGDVLEFADMGEEGYEYKEGYDFTNRAIVGFKEGRFMLDKFADYNSAVVEELNLHDETVSTIKFSLVVGNIYENPELMEGGKNA
ncbi:YopX family protein [Paenibacillus sp. FSL E2-0190]|uniref:YopX family protein n=1 Tax=Paenibacillus sp. FSL E2-0190 TaxID=2954504 RepID=UPI0030EED0DD